MSEGGKRQGSGHDEAYRAPVHDGEAAPVNDAQLRRRGKLWVAAMMVVFTLAVAVRVIAAVKEEVHFSLAFRIEDALRQSSAGLLLSLLLFLVYRGKNWARWLVIAWLVFTVIAIAWLEHRHPQFNLEGLVRKGVGLWTLGMLLFSPSVRALVTPPPRRWLD